MRFIFCYVSIRLFTCSGVVAAATEAGRIHLVQVESDESMDSSSSTQSTFTTSDGLARLRVDPSDSGRLASGGRENPLRVWDVDAQKTLFTAKNVRSLDECLSA